MTHPQSPSLCWPFAESLVCEDSGGGGGGGGGWDGGGATWAICCHAAGTRSCWPRPDQACYRDSREEWGEWCSPPLRVYDDYFTALTHNCLFGIPKGGTLSGAAAINYRSILSIILTNNPVIGLEIYCAHNILFILYIYNILALTWAITPGLNGKDWMGGGWVTMGTEYPAGWFRLP